jgi:NAD(P)-dependent dehydrogenase (short-subunit alcohol dehydrogenase family)
VTTVLRSGLLQGTRFAFAHGEPPGPLASAAAARALELGAAVETVSVDPVGDEPKVGGAFDVLLWDGQGAFAARDGVDAVRVALDGAWLAIRPVATQAMEGGGLVLLLAPVPGDAHHEAARSGLENLARTLSIEWSRLAVRPVVILPGAATTPAEVAELVAFLASPAGAYYSGCAFALGAA